MDESFQVSRLQKSGVASSREEERMRHVIIGSFVLGLCAAAPVIAMAQGRVPHAESTAVGLDVGVFTPKGDQLDNAPVISGFYEYYFTPRVSLRPSVTWSDANLNGSSIDSVRQVPVRVDLNYNWEGGKLHPFVGTGLGAYFMQLKHNGQSVGDSETKFGLNVGGGVEYFLHRPVTLKAEGRYHAINDFRGIEPSGLVFTAGLKTYF
jgi:outer membrane protein W